MKIGFFGGSFNPPTTVHIDIAKELIKNKIVDKLIFVPVGDTYKKPNLAPAKERSKMLELAISNIEGLQLDDFEVKSNKQYLARDVFKIITEKYHEDVYFIMGSDNFMKMENWQGYDEIINKYKYIVITRKNFKVQSTNDNIIIFNPKKQYNFDSTIVRKLIVENKDISNLLDKKVYNYIKQNNLYINRMKNFKIDL